MIADSGARRVFSTGAVRDIREGAGKGRFDLLPFVAVGMVMDADDQPNIGQIFSLCDKFRKTGEIRHLTEALFWFFSIYDGLEIIGDTDSMLLEVAQHFEEGALKYGERNWEKGIPIHCYIDSGLRHLIKHRAGMNDERHDRAFCWNFLCAIQTMIDHPEMDDFTLPGIERNKDKDVVL